MAQRIIQNIVGGIHRHELSKVSQAYSLNMYPESVDSDQSITDKILLGIHGTSLGVEIPEGPCRGLFRASRGQDGNPVLFGCFGSGVYVIRETGTGFSALPAGYYGGDYESMGFSTYFWSSTCGKYGDELQPYSVSWGQDKSTVEMSPWLDNGIGCSVRCVKD